MEVDKIKCLGCRRCSPYCPMGAISFSRDRGYGGKIIATIDLEECVECGVCLRTRVCPTEALYQPLLEWPRTVRSNFSDPLVEHKETRIPGRGTEEIKTNEVTGRFKHGEAGLAIELGRPGIGARFQDVEKVALAMAKLGAEFEPKNPVTTLMMDKKTGKINDAILNEKVLSAIVEFSIKLERLPEYLKAIEEVSKKIDTVFSLDLICRVAADGSIPTVEIAEKLGWRVSINGKTNVGLGRPLAKEV